MSRNVTIRLGTGGIFPISVHSSGRYLVNSQQTPVFIHGNATWSLSHNWTLTEAEAVLDSLVAKGFNAVIFSGTDTFDNAGSAAYPENLPDRNAESPFTSGLTPNEDYWAHIDDVMDAIKERNMVAFFSPLYLGFNDEEGIRTLITAQSTAACEDYGEFIATRYGGYGNIIWTHGGDANPESWASKILAFRTGLDNVLGAGSAYNIHGSHWDPNSMATQFSASGFTLSWFGILNTYVYDDGGFGTIPSQVYDNYGESGPKPVIMFESRYEGDSGATGADVVPFPYRALLSGACGHFFGNRPLWFGTSDYTTSLASTGHTYMSYLPTLLSGRAWHTLVPSRDSTLITSGMGDPDAVTGVQAALNSARTLAMAFCPSNSSITVSLAAMTGLGSIAAKWFPVRTGSISSIGTYSPSGTQVFTPPNSNGNVLILESA